MSRNKKKLGCLLAMLCGLIPNSKANFSERDSRLPSVKLSESHDISNSNDIDSKIRQQIKERRENRIKIVNSLSNFDGDNENSNKEKTGYGLKDFASDVTSASGLLFLGLAGNKIYNKFAYGKPLFDSKLHNQAFKDLSLSQVRDLTYDFSKQNINNSGFVSRSSNGKTLIYMCPLKADEKEDTFGLDENILKSKISKIFDKTQTSNLKEVNISGKESEYETLVVRAYGQGTAVISGAPTSGIKHLCIVGDENTDIFIKSESLKDCSFLEVHCKNLFIENSNEFNLDEAILEVESLSFSSEKLINSHTVTNKSDAYLVNGLNYSGSKNYNVSGCLGASNNPKYLIISKK